MAVDVYGLLSLPSTSNGLSAFKSTSVKSLDDGSASPPHKSARLARSSDATSARTRSAKQSGPVVVRIGGIYKATQIATVDHLKLVIRSIRIILTKDSSDELSATHEAIYNSCLTAVVLNNQGRTIYDALRVELEKSLGRLVDALADSRKEGLDWISSLVQTFEWFEKQVTLLQSLLVYVDQAFAAKETDVVKIGTLAFSKLFTAFFEDPRISPRMLESVQVWLDHERKLSLDHKDRGVMPKLVEHLLTYGHYPIFENFYVQSAQTFFGEESDALASTHADKPSVFVQKALDHIKRELERAEFCLPAGSWALLRSSVEKALMEKRVEWVSTGALKQCVEAKDTVKLKALYRLLGRIGSKSHLASSFKQHVQQAVEFIVTDQTREDDIVTRLLPLKQDLDHIISSSFLDLVPVQLGVASTSATPAEVISQEFKHALNDAFVKGYKAKPRTPAEMLAKHLDKTLRKGQGVRTDVVFENELDAVLALYRYSEDKDVFRTWYHRQLAKRLLLDKTSSIDLEKTILRKLKDQYDPEFGSATDMFNDLALSRDMAGEYHSKLPEDSDGRQLSVFVLQHSAWPFGTDSSSKEKDKSKVPKVVLPLQMQQQLEAYEAFYKTKHGNRLLTWEHILGTVTLAGRFTQGQKELSVSLFQAIILLLFNGRDDISFADIAAETCLEDAELRRTLQSLACGKKKVLKKVPAGRDVGDDDVFRYNADFEDPRAKVHINSIQAKVSPEENRRTQIMIDGDRKQYLDAAIVRIMKARKEMSYEALKIATIDAMKSHFVPQVDIIKQRIDSLVENEYLKRSEKDKNAFQYIA